MCALPASALPEATHLSRMQVWGGNCNIERNVHVAGFTGWVFSRAFAPATCGGDIYFFSVSMHDMMYRVVLADVSGHGAEFNVPAQKLEALITEHINTHDQSELMRDLNTDILRENGKYATAVVLGYQRPTGTLFFTCAGHPPALWYHAATGAWDFLHEDTEHALKHEGLPIGLIPDTDYVQTAVQFAEGDVIVLYTDGFAEATDRQGNELGYDGMKSLAAATSISAPHTFGMQLLDAIGEFCGRPDYDDDRTLVVLRRS